MFLISNVLLVHYVVSHSAMSDSANQWTLAHQASLSIDFSRQGYWSGLPFLFSQLLLTIFGRYNDKINLCQERHTLVSNISGDNKMKGENYP